MFMHDPFMHDPFTWPGHVHPTGNIRWPGNIRWVTGRRLAAIERELSADAPGLSAKFDVFNQLTGGERPTGAELIPSLAWPRLRPVHLAVLAAMMALTALCVALSLQLQATVRPCSAATSAAARATSQGTGLDCASYPGTSQPAYSSTTGTTGQ